MSLPFSRAVEGFVISLRARGLSPNTIESYLRAFKKFQDHHGDLMMDAIKSSQIDHFLAAQPVSKKSKKNYFIALSSLWTWSLGEKLVTVHVLRELHAPKPEERSVEPMSAAEVKDIMGAVNRSRVYRIAGGIPHDHSLPNALRDRAVILLLLDTGMRASELCGLTMADVNIKKNSILVHGKGDKDRNVPISSRTAQALWRYVATREPGRPSDSVFTTRTGDPLDRRRLAHQLQSIGRRAGVPHVHPHRFRHTFAINYLRNGGDIYTLQNILGHSTLEMVRKYLRLAQVDMEDAHRRASPVENWRL
jgi:integrase/recombinase XerD